MTIASQFGTGQVVWSLFWLTVFTVYVWLALTVIANVIQQPDVTNASKAAWVALALLVPYLGAFIYVAVHGERFSENDSTLRRNGADANNDGN